MTQQRQKKFQMPKSPQYIVQKILNYKIVEGKQLFLAQWKGYQPSEATWEPIQNLYYLQKDKNQYQAIKQKYLLKKTTKNQREKSRLINSQSYSSSSEKSLLNGKCQKSNQVKRNYNFISKRRVICKSKKEKKRKRYSLKRAKDQVAISDEDLEREQSSYNNVNQKQPEQGDIKLQQIALQVKGIKNPLFIDKEISKIKATFVKGGQKMYQVQFQNYEMQEPVMLHEKYLKLLWPKKLAEFLISKIKPSGPIA